MHKVFYLYMIQIFVLFFKIIAIFPYVRKIPKELFRKKKYLLSYEILDLWHIITTASKSILNDIDRSQFKKKNIKKKYTFVSHWALIIKYY